MLALKQALIEEVSLHLAASKLASIEGCLSSHLRTRRHGIKIYHDLTSPMIAVGTNAGRAYHSTVDSVPLESTASGGDQAGTL